MTMREFPVLNVFFPPVLFSLSQSLHPSLSLHFSQSLFSLSFAFLSQSLCLYISFYVSLPTQALSTSGWWEKREKRGHGKWAWNTHSLIIWTSALSPATFCRARTQAHTHLYAGAHTCTLTHAHMWAWVGMYSNTHSSSEKGSLNSEVREMLEGIWTVVLQLFSQPTTNSCLSLS